MADNHTFIINTDNALDTASYAMYFYEEIHNGRISFFEEPTVTNEMISEVAEKIQKNLNRNTFGIQDYRIVFIIARNCSEHQNHYLCDLYVFEQLRNHFNSTQLNKIKVCFINRYEETVGFSIERLKSKFERINEEMLLNGYLEFEEDARTTGIIPCKSSLIGKEVVEFSDNAGAHGIRKIIETCRGENVEEDIFDAYTAKFRILKEAIDKIDYFNVDINTLTPESQVEEQLYLCRFILEICKNAQLDGNLSERYEKFKKNNKELLAEEACTLSDYSERVKLERKRLSAVLADREQKISTEYEYREPLPSIDSAEEIGGDDDIRAIIQELNRDVSNPDWETEYSKLLDKLNAYETKLFDYGKSLSRVIHKELSTRKETTEEFGDLNYARESIEKQLEEAMDKYYELKKPAQDNLSTMLDITNQYHVIVAALRRRRAFKESSIWSRYLRVLFAGLMAVLVPYSLSQTYIYSALIRGSMIPLFSFLVFFISFLFAKGIVAIAMNFRFRKEMQKFERLIKKYMSDLKLRQTHFHETVNSMIQVNNVISMREALESEARRQNRERNLLNYHKLKLEEREKAMKHFTSFIRNAGSVMNKTTIDSTSSVEIVPEKDVPNNEFYWI